MIRFNDERLKEMSFLAFLDFMKGQIESLRHIPKTDSAYHDAKDISRRIISRYITETKTGWDDYYKLNENANNIRLDEEILDKYKFKDSDKGKKYIIDEFKSEMLTDLRHLIFEQSNKQENN